MKKLAILTLAAILTAALPVSAAFAQTAPSADITVNLANGELILAGEPIRVTDVDSDGVLTVYDAMVCLHDAKYEGGAEAGFSAPGGFIGRLWGVENGGAYGYCINNASAMSLSEPIKDGDILYAYVYTDLDFWSDCYTYFDMDTVSVKAGESVTLTLKKSSMWYPEGVTLPVEDAVITIDGAETEYTTDEDGKVTLTLDAAGKHIISAISEDEVLVPPVCIATVVEGEKEPDTTPEPTESKPSEPADPTEPTAPSTGDLTVLYTALTLAAVSAGTWICRRRSRDDA